MCVRGKITDSEHQLLRDLSARNVTGHTHPRDIIHEPHFWYGSSYKQTLRRRIFDFGSTKTNETPLSVEEPFFALLTRPAKLPISQACLVANSAKGERSYRNH